MLVVLGLAWLTVVAFWIVMVIDAARVPTWAYEQADRSKGMTVFLTFITGIIGALYYYFAVRKDVVGEARRGALRPTRGDADDFRPPST